MRRRWPDDSAPSRAIVAPALHPLLSFGVGAGTALGTAAGVWRQRAPPLARTTAFHATRRSGRRPVVAAPHRPTQHRAGAPSAASGLLLSRKQESPPALLVVVPSRRLRHDRRDARIHLEAGSDEMHRRNMPSPSWWSRRSGSTALHGGS